MKSMTGFGRCEMSDETKKISVEIKSVNHRYLDVNIKMPKRFNSFEANIRTLLKKSIQRGKIDLYITYEDLEASTASLFYNIKLAEEYNKHFRQMAHYFGIENDTTVSKIASCPEVFVMKENPVVESSLWNLLEHTIEEAVRHFVEARSLEGKTLKHDLLEKLEGMFPNVEYIEERSPELLKEYHKKLEEKVKELLENTSMDEARILSEVAIYADKICIDEELVRLRGHILHMVTTLEEGEGVGRKLDFIAQEMNREANTILSKSNDLDVTNHAIILKTEIEKIREQIQNIE